MKIVLLEPGDKSTRDCFLAGFKKVQDIQLAIASAVYPSHKGQWFEKYTDQFISFSFNDFEGLKKSVEEFSADCVVTYYDLCLDFANDLNKTLGKMPIYSAAESPSRKSFQRSRLLAEKLPSARFVAIEDSTPESLASALRIGFPCVVKPCQLTSSLGVSICRNEQQLLDAILKASQADFWDEKVRELIPGLSKQVLVEEYLEGEEISVEGYAYNGAYKCLGFTKKLRSYLVHLDELGHVFPHPGMPFEGILKTEIEQYLEKVHSALGIMNSVTHAEIKINAQNEPALVELNCRPGGGMISEMMRLSGCCDVPALMLALAGGLEFPPLRASNLLNYSSLFIYSSVDGQLKEDVGRFAISELKQVDSFSSLKNKGDFLLKENMNETARCGIALVEGVHEALPPLPSDFVRTFLALRSLQDTKVCYFWATPEELDGWFDLEKECWKELSASRETIGARISFNERATLVAYDVATGKCLGFLTQVPIPKSWAPPLRTWEQLAALSTDSVYMSQIHNRNDLVSFGVSIASIPNAPHGLASSLFEVLVSQIETFGCSKFVGGIRMAGLKNHFSKGGNLETYVKGLLNGQIYDPIYGAVVLAGGVIHEPIPEYYEDDESCNYGLKIEISPKALSETVE